MEGLFHIVGVCTCVTRCVAMLLQVSSSLTRQSMDFSESCFYAGERLGVTMTSPSSSSGGCTMTPPHSVGTEHLPDMSFSAYVMHMYMLFVWVRMIVWVGINFFLYSFS